MHTPAPAPPPIPPPSETPATRAAGETAQSPPNSTSPSPRSTHSPAPPHLSPAAAAASALAPRKCTFHSQSSWPQLQVFSQTPPGLRQISGAIPSRILPHERQVAPSPKILAGVSYYRGRLR